MQCSDLAYVRGLIRNCGFRRKAHLLHITLIPQSKKTTIRGGTNEVPVGGPAINSYFVMIVMTGRRLSLTEINGMLMGAGSLESEPLSINR